MANDDVFQCVGSLLHCVHGDNAISGQNALLQYCGLRMLEGVLAGRMSWNDYKGACWSIRERLAQPAIRFLKLDPINAPPRRVPGTRSVLVLPNNTSLDSQSTLQTQASARYAFRLERSPATLGAVVRSEVQQNDYYDEVWHMVCRKPSDPKVRQLCDALMQLVPGEHVVVFRVPVFGQDGEWAEWANGLARLLFLQRNIQNAAAFIDLCFVDKSSHEAGRIEAELRCSEIPHKWPADG
jgi:hypothetical protein